MGSLLSSPSKPLCWLWDDTEARCACTTGHPWSDGPPIRKGATGSVPESSESHVDAHLHYFPAESKASQQRKERARSRAEPLKGTLSTGMNRACAPARPARTLCNSPSSQKCALAGKLARASAPRASPVNWFFTGAADANETEMLFFAFLLELNAMWAKEFGELNNWA